MSLYGFGEYIDSYDAGSIGIGDMMFFSGTKENFTLSSPATYSELNYSNLSMSISFNESNSANILKLTSNNFHYFSFIFPFEEKYAFSIGMNPVFRTNMSIIENEYKPFQAT